MKIFWSFIALIMLGTALLYFVPSLTAKRQQTAVSVAMSDTADEEKGPTLPAKRDGPSIQASKIEDDPADENTTSSNPKPLKALDLEFEPLEDAIPPVVEDILEIVENNVGEDSTLPAPESSSMGEAPNALVATESGLDADPASSEMAPEEESKVDTTMPNEVSVSEPDETAPSNSKERFKVQGSGTKDAPYRVTWEMLTSAYESYRPREDKNEIPEWVQMLHDKYVRISGYLAFPMLTGEVDEALVMLNQWDGCCLGVPPSPYDSIEVRLANTMIAERGAFTPFGAVEGKLLVDPYLVNGWLVGLYLMEEALVETVE